MSRTRSLLIATFGHDLGQLINSYFRPPSNKPKDIALAGAFEECMCLPIGARALERVVFRNACQSGYTRMVNALIKRGANAWRAGALGAARGGHSALLAKMKKKCSINPQKLLWEVCCGNHRNMIDATFASCQSDRRRPKCLSLARWAEIRRIRQMQEYKVAIGGAARGGHADLVADLQAKHDDQAWDTILSEAAVGGHVAIALDALKHIVDPYSLRHAMHQACIGDHPELIRHLVANGCNPNDYVHLTGCHGRANALQALIACGAIPCYCPQCVPIMARIQPPP